MKLVDDLKLDEFIKDLKGKTFKTADFEKKLIDHYGKRPKIRCLNFESLLEEITFCYDKETLKQFNCGGRTQCGNQIKIPTSL